MTATEEPEDQGLLGYRNDPGWDDMSEFVVHMTRSADSLISILTQGVVKAVNAHGWAREYSKVKDRHRSACFSEIPVNKLDRLSRHRPYGLGFRKSFVVENGGARVWYLDRPPGGDSLGNKLYKHIGDLMRAQDSEDKLWEFTPFIDPIIPGTYDWDWEREWRVPGGLAFTVKDVAFLVSPSGEQLGIRDTMNFDGVLLDFHEIGDMEDIWFEIDKTVESIKEKVFAQYADPVEGMPWEDGEYVEIVPFYDTEDVITFVAGDLEPSFHQKIAAELNDISMVWYCKKDFDDLASGE